MSADPIIPRSYEASKRDIKRIVELEAEVERLTRMLKATEMGLERVNMECNGRKAEVERLRKALADTATCSSDKIIRYQKALEDLSTNIEEINHPVYTLDRQRWLAKIKEALNHEH